MTGRCLGWSDRNPVTLGGVFFAQARRRSAASNKESNLLISNKENVDILVNHNIRKH
jgi:hypothetical protein